MKGNGMSLLYLISSFVGPFLLAFFLATRVRLPYFLIAPFTWRAISQWFVVNVGGVIALIATYVHSTELGIAGLSLMGLSLGLIAGNKKSLGA
jgi:hypothetical protein